MSVKAMAWAWQQELPTTAKFVLLALADHSDDLGIAWPGITGIAAKTCLSSRAVQTQIRLLTAKNLLSIQLGGGRTHTNIYQLNLVTPQDMHPLSQKDERDSVNVVPKKGERGAERVNVVPKRVNDVHPNHHEPSYEPSLEPSIMAKPAKKAKTELQERRNALKEKLVEVCGYQPATPTEWGSVEKAVSLILSANGTPADVQQRHANLQKHWPNITIKPMTLASNWGLAENAPSRAGLSSNGRKPRGGRAVDLAETELIEGYIRDIKARSP